LRPTSALISMGVYAFKREVLMRALSESCNKEEGWDFGHHLIPSLVGSAHIRAYDFRDQGNDLPCYWRDIGTLDSYYETSMDLVRAETPFDPCARAGWPSYPRNEHSTHASARLNCNCRVTRSILSPGVCIESGGLIESSVLMSRVRVGKNAKIRHAIVEEGVHIPAGFEIGYDLEKDREEYMVTGTGVVVVSQTPKHPRSIFVCGRQRIRSKSVVASSAA
jgi:glucose-1-phosphate adenylyltransferase